MVDRTKGDELSFTRDKLFEALFQEYYQEGFNFSVDRAFNRS